jgi:predicted transcriptional regulator of viral defense system
MLDLFAMPHVFGSLQAGLETLEAHLNRLDVDKLVGYALRYDVGAVIKRLGWALETMGVPERVTAPLQAYPLRAYSQLDPTGHAGGEPVARWRLRNNLVREGIDAHS